MKKLISLIAFTLVTFTTHAQSYCYDTNGDGAIDIADVTCLVNKILDIPIPGTALGPVTSTADDSYDTNGDGEINIADVTCLVNKILGIDNPGETITSYFKCPDSNHPHLIDLGLPSGTKWACCNVGANKPEAYGSYYAWGETEEKSTYDWNSYTHCNGSSDTCHDLGIDITGIEYDVAHKKWGGCWVLPNNDHAKELLDNCTYEWTMWNNVRCGKFTSKINGAIIYLPAAGQKDESFELEGLYNVGSNSIYWTSTQSPDKANGAGGFEITSDYKRWYHGFNRYYGHSVRPIVAE